MTILLNILIFIYCTEEGTLEESTILYFIKVIFRQNEEIIKFTIVNFTKVGSGMGRKTLEKTGMGTGRALGMVLILCGNSDHA